jgi:hypothetical protein
MLWPFGLSQSGSSIRSMRRRVTSGFMRCVFSLSEARQGRQVPLATLAPSLG